MDPISSLAAIFRSSDLPIMPVPVRQFLDSDISAETLRLDQLHPVVSGNKWFKLKYHLSEALKRKSDTIITFGGSWSNHIVATAFACREAALNCVGIIRGEEPAAYSQTLKDAMALGIQLRFLSRNAYAGISRGCLPVEGIDANAYYIPAGGAGEPGIEGSKEILELARGKEYTHIICSIGTGTMFAGLVLSAEPGQTILGVPALKGFNHLPLEYLKIINGQDRPCRFAIFDSYHFGGFAKKTQELIHFMNSLYSQTGIETDFVYTGKLFYACADLAVRGLIPRGSKILIIHSGGLQGNASLPAGLLQF